MNEKDIISILKVCYLNQPHIKDRIRDLTEQNLLKNRRLADVRLKLDDLRNQSSSLINYLGVLKTDMDMKTQQISNMNNGNSSLEWAHSRLTQRHRIPENSKDSRRESKH